jgi:hypothetical protein
VARGSVSLGRFAPTLNSTHILSALVLLRKSLFGLAKRRKQPERYMTWVQKLVEKYRHKIVFDVM